jgi:hypothetical protein
MDWFRVMSLTRMSVNENELLSSMMIDLTFGGVGITIFVAVNVTRIQKM